MLALFLLLQTATALDCIPDEQLPSPGTAAALSGFIGFGAGHFYSQRPGVGAIFAVVETAGLGLIVGGYASQASASGDFGGDGVQRAQTGATLAVAGWATSAVSRGIDSGVASTSARKTAQNRGCTSVLRPPPSNRPEQVPVGPLPKAAPTATDVELMTAAGVMRVLGLSANDIVQMKIIKPWVAELLSQGLAPGEIIQKAKLGEAPIQSPVVPETTPATPL